MRNKTKILLIFILAIISISMIGFYPQKPNRIAYSLPPSQLINKDWEEILNTSPKIDKFKVLNTGSVKVPLSGMLNEINLMD